MHTGPIPWPLGQQPTRLLHPAIVATIRRIYKADHDLSIADMSEAAQFLLDTDAPKVHLGESKLTRAQHLMLHALRIQLTAVYLKNEIYGEEADAKLLNRLTGVVGEEVAELLPLDLQVHRYLDHLYRALEVAARDDGDVWGWFYPKVYRAYMVYDNRIRWVSFIQKVFTDQQMKNLVGFGLVAPLARIDQLAALLMKLRKYGVKTSYFRDDILSLPMSGLAWVFLDGYQGRSVYERTGYQFSPDRIADVYLAEVKSLRNIQLTKSHAGGAGMRAVEAYSLSIDRHLSMSILPDGHLDGGGLIEHRLEKYFAEAGRPQAYQVMRLMQLIRLFDLTVPVSIVRALPEAARLNLGQGKKRDRREREFRPVRDLFLPRLAAARATARLIREIEREIAAASSTPATPRVGHDVPGFMRPLPDGCRATPAAHQLAWDEMRQEIPDGHTYVKNHHRGSGPGKVVIHEAKTR